MYSLIVNNISNYGKDYFGQPLLESLKDQLSKRAVIVALVALSCLTAVYLAYTCYWVKKEDKEDLAHDVENQDLSLDSLSPVHRHEASEKIDDLKVEKEPKSVDILENYLFEDKEEELIVESEKSDLKQESISNESKVKPADVKQNSSGIEKPKVEPKQLDLKQKGLLEEEQVSIKAIKRNWLDNPHAEIKRLREAAVFPHSMQATMTQLTGISSYATIVSDKKDQISMIVGRVLELKNFYQKTHYVFTHGQSTEISVANRLIKELVHKFTPPLHHPLKIPFRVPHTVTYSENADDFVTKYKAVDANMDYADNKHNAEMISVDAYFWNIDSGESALHYLKENTNINLWGDTDALLKIFKTIISNYVIEDEALLNMLANKACKIANQKKTETQVGTFYAICVPKSIVQDEKRNFAYQCHPFGKKCSCFPTTHRIAMLEEMQTGKLFTCSTNFSRPQYRLLTSRLTEEKDVRSFAVDALPERRRKFYRDQVKELVAEIHQYSHLSDLVEQLAEGVEVMDQIQSLIEASTQLDLNYIKRIFAAKELFYQ